ncbi:segregation/condensation protein A [Acaryochloris sp. IP29b_bin.148]|uniref:segregation/condensation protein A n=1 Tax=Acaryochloris sp. IP29b_bin.148 TaxID=2969218 RepID=UPI0026018952|nr:segregation/condensation protein A [Acaryochloris sp. IP29b_bin.148]
MSRSFAQNAISMLIDLAQRGEIDPWDVQVIDVFDRFLSHLSYQDSQELSDSGQAFLYASMLVLLKAETLGELTTEPEEPEDMELFLFDDAEAESNGLPSPLEKCLLRRPTARPPQRRRVTLNELINQLELMAVAVERQGQRPRVRKVRRASKAKSMKAIAQLAHQENLSEVAEQLEEIFARLDPNQDWLDFEELLTFMNDRVGVFWALLLLCAQSKVELDQQEFYMDLRLKPLTPEPATVELLPNLKSAAS